MMGKVSCHPGSLQDFRDKTQIVKLMKKILYTVNTRAGALLLAAGLVLTGSALAFDINSKDKSEHPSVNVPIDETSVGRDTLPHGSYAPVVKKVTPAVVKIVTTSK